MKKSIPEYINTLSDGDFEILEEIFDNKYSQMMALYWLIRDYSDVTTSLTYDGSVDSNVLRIEMTLLNHKPKKVVEEIESNIDEDSSNIDVSVWYDGKVIYLELIKEDESETE
jgi:hypothetical protein